MPSSMRQSNKSLYAAVLREQRHINHRLSDPEIIGDIAKKYFRSGIFFFNKGLYAPALLLFNLAEVNYKKLEDDRNANYVHAWYKATLRASQESSIEGKLA